MLGGEEGRDEQVTPVPQQGHLKLVEQVDDVSFQVLSLETQRVLEEQTQVVCPHRTYEESDDAVKRAATGRIG